MTGSAMVTAIIEILVSGITGIATGIGTGLSTLAKAIFLEEITSGGTTTTQLSTFGTLIVVFAGISLAIGLSRLVVKWLSSLGGHQM